MTRGAQRVAGRTASQEKLLPGRDGFTDSNPDYAGQVDLTGKGILT
jgi:hypothetical protein